MILLIDNCRSIRSSQTVYHNIHLCFIILTYNNNNNNNNNNKGLNGINIGYD